MVLFFVLAGASLDLDSFDVIWGISIAYIVLRTFSRVISGWLGGRLAGASVLHRRWIGLALIPQAGVALGMALVASNHFPGRCQSKILNTWSGHRTPQIDPKNAGKSMATKTGSDVLAK